MCGTVLIFSQTTNFTPSKLKELDDILIFAENSRKFSKWVENTDEQFLHFLQCFQMTCTADT